MKTFQRNFQKDINALNLICAPHHSRIFNMSDIKPPAFSIIAGGFVFMTISLPHLNLNLQHFTRAFLSFAFLDSSPGIKLPYLQPNYLWYEENAMLAFADRLHIGIWADPI